MGVWIFMNFIFGFVKGFRNMFCFYNDDIVWFEEKVSDFWFGFKVVGREFGFGFYDGIFGFIM